MNITAHFEAPDTDSSALLTRQRRLLLLCGAFWLLWLVLRRAAPASATYLAEAAPIIPLVAFLSLWLMAVALGGRLLDKLHLGELTAGERLFFASLLGFAALSVTMFILAALELLHDWAVCGWFAFAAICLSVTLRAGSTPPLLWREWWHDLRSSKPAKQCAVALLAFSLVLGIAGAMAPATDNDTLLYHLAAPSIYVQHGGFVYVPHNLWTNIPLFTEMMYSAGLCVMNQTLARLFVPCSYLLLLVGCWCFTRRHLPQASPWLPALLVGSIPLLAILNSTSLNDVTLLAYEMAALFAFVGFWRARTTPERRSWLILCAVACGAAGAIKYVGLLPALVLIPASLLRLAAVERWRGAAVGSLICLAGMALPGMWLGKNVVYTGNPVYPVAFSVFGGRNWTADLAAEYKDHMMGFGLHDEGLLGALKAPALIAFDEERFGSKLGPGPLFLLLAPLALFSVRRISRTGRFIFAYALVHYVAWAVGPQVVRYIMPGLVVWSFVLAESVATLPGRPAPVKGRASKAKGPRALVRGIVCAGAAFNIAWFAVSQQALIRPFDAIWGMQARQAYIQREVPYYNTISYANTAIGDTGKVLFVGEWRTFYTQVPFEADTGPDVTIICEYVNQASDLDDLVAALSRDGFTHVLYNPAAEELLQRTFGYLRFASPDKERMYRELPTQLPLVHAEHGVFLYELKRSRQRTAIAHAPGA